MKRLFANTIIAVYTQELSRLEDTGWCFGVRHLSRGSFLVTGRNAGEQRSAQWVVRINSVEEARAMARDILVEVCTVC